MADNNNCGSKKLTTLVIGNDDLIDGIFKSGCAVVLSKSISDQIRVAGRIAPLSLEGKNEMYTVKLTRPRGNKGEYYAIVGKPLDVTSQYSRC